MEFQEYLDHIMDINLDEINDLYLTIITKVNYGSFYYSETEDGRIFIKNNVSDITLLLATEKAKKTFLNILNKQWGGDFEDVAMYWDYLRVINKDD